jgi:hypothetical protein
MFLSEGLLSSDAVHSPDIPDQRALLSVPDTVLVDLLLSPATKTLLLI